MKKITQTILFLFALLFMFQCNNTHTDIIKEAVADTNVIITSNDTNLRMFKNFAEEFLKTIQKENLFQHTFSIYGLYVLDNPGAFIMINNFKKKEEFLSFSNRDIYKSQFSLQEGDLPEFSCENEDWNKKGAYWKKDTFDIVLKAYDWMIEYELAEIDKESDDYLNAQTLSKKETYCVYVTDIFVGFYFIEIDNNYYLYMLDLIEPCSA